ncbi:restriction endonuclease FokI C-terminal domain-containing protein [Pseudoscardovia suis]|uniref:restriction endonuclease FokI C-terminal domain-containing protein n=1 Tax=Pseudoscardovia suis TaxID=987063 RepID=UPI003F9B712E
MIKIEEFKRFHDRTFGLGQDVAQNLDSEVEIASLFIPESLTYKKMVASQLHERTVEAGSSNTCFETLLAALINQQMTYKNLVSVGFKDGKSTPGREPYATGLIRALIKGQRNPAITNWAAANYLSLTIGLGLLDFHYDSDQFTITELGKQAVALFDAKTPESEKELHDFLLERLYEYPYAAWLIRWVNQKDWGHIFTKFELGAEFGFIDEAGFTSIPEIAFVDQIAYAKAMGNHKVEKETRSNFEGTSDKYMRWLCGMFVEFGLLQKTTKTVTSDPINGKTYQVEIQAYQATPECRKAINYVDGKSSHRRSPKRVRWEYLAPKSQDASRRKTIRALELKFLSESPNGRTFSELADKINETLPELRATPGLIADDIKGLNRIGIQIDMPDKTGDACKLIDKLFDFIIPVKADHVFTESKAQEAKDKIRPYLTHVDHRYLKGIDIAFKTVTTHAEDTELEQLSTELFTNEMGYKGRHLGGSSKPDGIAYTDDRLWILDSKAYHKSFTLTKTNTDPMYRYIMEYREKKGTVDWWSEIPSGIPKDNAHFVYVSGGFSGNYQKQLSDFEDFVKMKGSLMEITKLILLAEKYQRGEIDKAGVEKFALDTNFTFDKYYPLLTNN